jgi:hypothetical protein
MPELQVLPHGHMRIRCVILKDHRNVAILSRHMHYRPSVDQHITVGDELKVSDAGSALPHAH